MGEEVQMFSSLIYRNAKRSRKENIVYFATIFQRGSVALTPDMTREEVIEKVSQAFGVADYMEFDLEIDFTDGSEQKYSDMK